MKGNAMSTRQASKSNNARLNNLKPSEEELAAAGLYRPEKYTWK